MLTSLSGVDKAAMLKGFFTWVKIICAEAQFVFKTQIPFPNICSITEVFQDFLKKSSEETNLF